MHLCNVLSLVSQHAHRLFKRCMPAQVKGAEAPAAKANTASRTSDGQPAAENSASQVSSKSRRKRSKKAKTSEKHLRQFLPSVTVDGETFRVGDSAYLMMTEDFDEDDFAETEVCQVCGSAEPDDIPRLECNKCLLGYHLTCLRPPLAEVPKVCQQLANVALLLLQICWANTTSFAGRAAQLPANQLGYSIVT